MRCTRAFNLYIKVNGIYINYADCDRMENLVKIMARELKGESCYISEVLYDREKMILCTPDVITSKLVV